MLIRKDAKVIKMQNMKATHETMSEAIQIASFSGTMSLMNVSERPRAPLENVRRYLSKFSLPDSESSQTFFLYSSCSFTALSDGVNGSCGVGVCCVGSFNSATVDQFSLLLGWFSRWGWWRRCRFPLHWRHRRGFHAFIQLSHCGGRLFPQVFFLCTHHSSLF